MISSFIITFRETLEAALIIGIILAYLAKTKRQKYNNVVYLGIISAIVASIIGAVIFNSLAGGFTGTSEKIFEGTAMIIAAFLITIMIIWMLKQRHIVLDLHRKIDKRLEKGQKTELFFLVFISIFREGIETVIFLGAAGIASGSTQSGAILGIATAILLGYLIFVVEKRVNLKVFFNTTSIILILFAAGLVAHGVHEFQEAKVLPTYIEHVYDINPSVDPAFPDTYPLIHEKGAVGSIFKGLFGYNGNPSLIEIIVYWLYLIGVFILYRRINVSPSQPP